ncbi:MAG: EfeM/EfeO family lipoprotein [Pseudomonadota bacterium]
MKKVSRRQFFEQAMGAGALTAIGATVLASGRGMPNIIGRAKASDNELGQAALRGVAYFRSRNETQIELVKKLQEAIKSRDLVVARQAYVDARPPYEEIETLAACFEESDADIDARPYAFDGGETSSDFRGFHKIEYFLFRDNDLDAAATFAETLAASHERLHKELAEPARYNPKKHFEGMIGLAEEIGSKKISSEEETWSDQSMLIFRSNIIGINSQYEPFSNNVKQRSEQVDTNVKSAYQAFRAVLKPYESGPGAAMTPYSQVRIGERKAISDATYRFRDSLIAAGTQLGVI